jgi:hypothetical protein
MRLGLFIVAITISSLFGCKEKSLDKVIIGKWQLSEFHIQDASVHNDVKEHAKKLAESVQYLFLEDGSYTITSSTIVNGKRGIWVYRKETNDLVLEMQNEAPSIIKVLETQPDLLICESPTSDSGQVNFELIRLTK